MASDILFDVDCKAEGQSLSGDAVHDAPCVVVAQCSAQLLVRHAWLVLACAPQLCDGVGPDDLELVAISCPLDDGAVVWREEEVEQELPQLNVTLVCRGRGGWEGKGKIKEERKVIMKCPGIIGLDWG